MERFTALSLTGAGVGRWCRPRLLVVLLLVLAVAGCAGGSGSNEVFAGGDAEEPTPGTAGEAEGGAPAGAPAEAMAREPAAEIQGDIIKIGMITVSEGPFAANGQRALEGAQFAVDEINAAGGVAGVPVELVVKDTRGSIEAVANIVRDLITEENVVALAGPVLSGECEVGCPLANELGTVVLSPGVGQPGVVEAAGPYIFSLVMPDAEHSGISLQPVLEEEDISTAVIFKDERDPASNFMGDQFWPVLFEDAGVEVQDVLTFTSGDPDFSAQVTRIKSLGPDAVALAAGPADAARIAIEVQRQGVDTQLLGSGALQSAGGDFLSAGGEAVSGAITAAQFDPEPDDEERSQLLDKYRQQTGSPATLNAAYAYDAIYIFVDVMKRTGVTNDPGALAEDRTKIKDGLVEIQDWLGMGGPTSIDEDGTVRRPAQIGTVEDGQFVLEQVEP